MRNKGLPLRLVASLWFLACVSCGVTGLVLPLRRQRQVLPWLQQQQQQLFVESKNKHSVHRSALLLRGGGGDDDGGVLNGEHVSPPQQPQQNESYSIIDAAVVSNISTTAATVNDPFSSSSSSSIGLQDSIFTAENGKKKKKKKHGWTRLFSSPLFMILAAFVMGHRVGSGKTQARLARLTESLETTASHYAAEAKLRPRSYLASGLLLYFFVRELWRALPHWLRPQIRIWHWVQRCINDGIDDDNNQQEQEQQSNLQTVDYFSTGGSSNTKSAPDDMTQLRILSYKLRSLAEIATRKVKGSAAEIGRPITWVDFVVLVKVLTDHLRDERAIDRDARYTGYGQAVANPATVLQGMDDLFDLADLAYSSDGEALRVALQAHNFTVVRFEGNVYPGSAAHYMAVDPKRKLAVLSIRGSTTFSDLLTDICMRAVPYELVGPFVEEGPTTVWVHDGISLATRRLANEFECLVEELLFPAGYKLIITGHSLGAAVASCLGFVLRSRLGRRHPELLVDPGNKIQVVGFACPPVLDHDAALACKPFTKTIINNSDVIPRWSISNFLMLMECMKKVSRKLEETKLRPTGPRSLVKFLRLVLTKRNKETQDPFLTMDEVRSTLIKSYEKVALRDPDHLYVPGTVVQMYDLWSKEGYYDAENSKGGKQSLNATGNVSSEGSSSERPPLRVAERIHIADGTSKVLRYIEIDPRMTSDHLSVSYRASIRDLISLGAQN